MTLTSLNRYTWSLSLTLLLFFASGLPAAPAADGAQRAEARRQAAESILKDLHQATVIRQGKSRHVMVGFIDPNCPYCHKLYLGLQAYILRGDIEMHWVLVGVLMETSPGKAASILEAPDPIAALDRNERGFSRETGFGAAIDDPLADAAVMAKLKRNADLLRRTGSESVPTLVFRVADGTAVVVTGAPPESYLKQIIPQVK